jgi:hypothetical protein
MMHSLKSSSPTALFAAALLALGGAAGLGAQEIERTAGAVTLRNADPAATAAFWESRRDLEVVPMPLRAKEGTPSAPDAFAAPGPAGSVPGVGPGGEPADLGGAEAIAAALGEDSPIFGGAQWYAYPPPHTNFFPQYGNKSYPHATLGKLFFDDGVSGFVCSGAVVVCSDQDLVMTAGHCCAPGDGVNFYDNWRFVPACVGANCNVAGTAPFGRWDWESVTVPTAWFTTGDLARDVCFLKVMPLGGLQIQNVTGSLGFAWNQVQPVSYVQTGWPAVTPFSGARLVFDLGSTADLDGSESPNTVGVGNGMTPGSSGGAWIKNYRHTANAGGPFWNGLNSYKYTVPARPDEMYGPYADTTVNSLRVSPGICP